MPCSSLFEPIRLGGLELANRIAVGPMCQYSAQDGCMNDWHLIHLGHLACSGAGLLTIETTAVLPEGRATPDDLGLWNNRNQAAMSLTIESIRRWCDVPIAIEVGHAGRRGSFEVPWRGGAPIASGSGRGWPTVAPFPLPYVQDQATPLALDRDDLRRIREGFAKAAVRASQAGVDAVQLHGADGHLLHQFLSPRSNLRDDAYGGSTQDRMRFPIEVFDSVRDVVPAACPVTVRIPACDGLDTGWTMQDAITLAHALVARGCDAFHVSVGGLTPETPPEPPQEVAAARCVKHAIGVPVIVAVAETDCDLVDAVIAAGDADVVALTRTIVDFPRWPWHAARSLRRCVEKPIQYRHIDPH